jgi:hypothetical protein
MTRSLRFAGILAALAATALCGRAGEQESLILGPLEISPAIKGGEWEIEPGTVAPVTVRVAAAAQSVEFFEVPPAAGETPRSYQFAVVERPADTKGAWTAECRYRVPWGARGSLRAVAQSADGKRTDRAEVKIWSPDRREAPPADECLIAFVRDGNVWTVTADGLEQTRITHDGSAEASANRVFYVAPCWANEKTVACLRAGGAVVTPGRTTVPLVSIAGGRREFAAPLSGAVALGVAWRSRRYAFLKLAPRRERPDGSWTQPVYLGTGWAQPISRYVAALGTGFGASVGPRLHWSPTERLIAATTAASQDALRNAAKIYDRYQARFIDTVGYPFGADWWAEQGFGPPAISDLCWLPDDSGWVIACPSGTTFWGADGTKRPMPIGLFLIGREDRSLIKLTSMRAADVAVSPDGKRAAFTAVDLEGDQPPSIWTINLDGTGLTKLADNAAQPDWQP